MTDEYKNRQTTPVLDFKHSVFINCPFDNDYRQLLISAIFTVKFLGFSPRLALESSDSSTTRLANIVNLIESCKFGIHDLSRLLSTKKGEHARMNMPFELGVDYGCKRFKPGAESKKILILEKERYRFQTALSDLSGSDIQNHNDDPIKLTKVIRDWFVTEELRIGPSPKKIWYDFNDFSADLEEKLTQEGHLREDFDEVPIPEIMSYMSLWFSAKCPQSDHGAQIDLGKRTDNGGRRIGRTKQPTRLVPQ